MGVRGLKLAAWVQGQLAQEFAGGAVQDADVHLVDEQEDAGAGEASSQPHFPYPRFGWIRHSTLPPPLSEDALAVRLAA
jgi:hypothetical protein